MKLLLALVAFAPSLAWSAPSISSFSGSLTQGSTITLTGSGFGSKVRAYPLVYDTFESGVFHSSWAAVNGLGLVNGGVDNRTPYSTKLTTHGFVQGDPKFATLRMSNTVHTTWYIEFWIKLSTDVNWGTTGYDGTNKFLSNIKLFRLWNPGNTTQDLFVAFDGTTNSIQLSIEGIDAIPFPYYMLSNASRTLTLGEWHKLAFEYVECSTWNAQDGQFKFSVDGVVRYSTTSIYTSTGPKVVATGAELGLKRPYLIGLENEWNCTENGGGGADPSCDEPNTIFMDEFYVDNTKQRIEVSTCASYMQGHKEIMFPTSWADGSVSGTLNLGNFASVSPLYFWVTDTLGAQSNGFPISQDKVIFGGSMTLQNVGSQ